MENLNPTTLDELERHAYITGDTARAALLGALQDTEAMHYTHAKELGSACEDVYQSGYADGQAYEQDN